MVSKATPKRGCGFQWMDMLRTGEKFLRAGLRREIGPVGDLDSAYRQWYEKRMEAHDKLLEEMGGRFRLMEEEKDHAS